MNVAIPYIDTDSLMVSMPEGLELKTLLDTAKECCRDISTGMFPPVLDCKGVYEKVIILVKKRYIYIENGKTKWIDDPESKFLQIAYSEIFHVDDPSVAKAKKDLVNALKVEAIKGPFIGV
jgi:DNA polymerase elongation subunit (family B)